MEKVIVTRHPALVDYLREEGHVGTGVALIEHATPEEVRGKHVYGVLPLWLAAEAGRVTEVTLRVPPEMRGRELTLKEVRQFFTGVATYEVKRL